jgi:hypothetical protein
MPAYLGRRPGHLPRQFNRFAQHARKVGEDAQISIQTTKGLLPKQVSIFNHFLIFEGNAGGVNGPTIEAQHA